VTSMETPRAWSKLEEAVFFLDHLRREHDAATAASAKAFGFTLEKLAKALRVKVSVKVTRLLE
jgi:hypothetical protein